MTDSKTGSKLTQSLRRAKTQKTVDTEVPVAKPRTRAKARPAKAAPAAATGTSFVLSSRCWPD